MDLESNRSMLQVGSFILLRLFFLFAGIPLVLFNNHLTRICSFAGVAVYLHYKNAYDYWMEQRLTLSNEVYPLFNYISLVCFGAKIIFTKLQLRFSHENHVVKVK